MPFFDSVLCNVSEFGVLIPMGDVGSSAKGTYIIRSSLINEITKEVIACKYPKTRLPFLGSAADAITNKQAGPEDNVCAGDTHLHAMCATNKWLSPYTLIAAFSHSGVDQVTDGYITSHHETHI